MAIKLVTKEYTFTPSVEVPTDEGMVNNRNLPVGEQIVCSLELASLGEKNKYIISYTSIGEDGEVKHFSTPQFEKAVREKCTHISGLEAFNITDGASLVGFKPLPVITDLIREIFYEVLSLGEDEGEVETGGGGVLASKE